MSKSCVMFDILYYSPGRCCLLFGASSSPHITNVDRVLFNNVIDELLLRCKDISLLREEEVDGKNDDDDDEKPITPTTTPCRRNEEANDDIIKIDVIIMYGVCWYIVFASFFYLCSRYADVLSFLWRGGES